MYVTVSPIYKYVGLVLPKNKDKLQRKACDRFQDFSEEEKTKNISMLVNDIEIFLKKKKTNTENMVGNDIKIVLKMKNKGYLSLGKIILKSRKIETD